MAYIVQDVKWIKLDVAKMKRTWYIPVTDNPEKLLHIRFWTDSTGYGGRFIKFNLVDGTTENVKGPYCMENWSVERMYFESDSGGKRPIDLVNEYMNSLILDEE